jgi:hypothetical protein
MVHLRVVPVPVGESARIGVTRKFRTRRWNRKTRDRLRINMHINAKTMERLNVQSELLLRIYQAELAKDPSSRATESSRSNMIALRHSIDQIYGEAASPGLLFRANPEQETTP